VIPLNLFIIQYKNPILSHLTLYAISYNQLSQKVIHLPNSTVALHILPYNQFDPTYYFIKLLITGHNILHSNLWHHIYPNESKVVLHTISYGKLCHYILSNIVNGCPILSPAYWMKAPHIYSQ